MERDGMRENAAGFGKQDQVNLKLNAAAKRHFL